VEIMIASKPYDEGWLQYCLESAFLKIGQHTVELIHIPSNEAPSHFQLHGHVHEKRPSKIISNQLNLCVEVWDYMPVAEKTILSLLDKASKQQLLAEAESELQNTEEKHATEVARLHEVIDNGLEQRT